SPSLRGRVGSLRPMYKLVISDDEGKTIIVPLVRDLITVGRQDGNTIRLTERNVSRQHARFTRDASGYRIEDLDSYNGITVNGVRIDGAADLKDGDRVGVGDYVIALRAEASNAATTRAMAARASAPAGFGAPPPARMVMISAPAPGAEFSMNKPALSIGRLEELDLCISHRSISREHARVTQKNGAFEIEDLRSANGVRVNGQSIKRSPLRSGDLVELGQVRFRFVGQGEAYVFDPEEEQEALSAPSGRTGPRGRTMVAVFGAFVVAAALLALSRDHEQAGAAMRKEVPAPPDAPAAGKAAQTAPSTEALPVDQGRLSQALDVCREGLAGGRYDEANRAADEGLALPGSGEDLQACKRSATDAQRATSAYDEGKKALAEDKTEDAYFLFAGIPDEHPLRQRPEVKATTDKVAADRLARAKKELRTAPLDARDLASSVLEMQGVSDTLRQQAQALLDDKGQPTPAPSATPAATVAVTPAAAVPPAKPRPVAAAAPVEPKQPHESKEAKPEDDDPAKVARNCLARGDQRCVVKALEGRAESAQELALLIETYRALGETKKAVKHMETFVAKYGTARQTPQYRQFIAKHEQ
ncbi:MAG: hypothetical protein JWN48_4026, partial [Myxococcaceae bacterium]|nr:hypothetical protein [Myxococcaceae bacterium]